MCGRYGFVSPREQSTITLIAATRAETTGDGVEELLVPRFNIAPSQPVIAARTWVRGGTPERRVDAFQWGLIPSWAKDPKIGHSLANARAETVTEKPAFRSAWKRGRRCLVPADVFYEWKDVGDATADPRNGDAPGEPSGATGKRPIARAPKPPKQPYAIRMKGDAPFCFAGLWEAWRNPAAEEDDPATWVPTLTLITTAPNSLMRRLHDRMPVIVRPAHFDAWLDPETPLDHAQALLAPYAPEAMYAYEVSRHVNSPGNDDPHVLDPLDPPPSAEGMPVDAAVPA
jgi:putative SOS response-associated peptidase YedK